LDPIKKFIYKPWNIGLGGAPLALDLGARKPGNKYIYIRMKAARPQGRKRLAQIYIYKNEGRKRPQV